MPIIVRAPAAPDGERCASAFSLVACSIAKDLAILTSIPFSPKKIVVVGTLIGLYFDGVEGKVPGGEKK